MTESSTEARVAGHLAQIYVDLSADDHQALAVELVRSFRNEVAAVATATRAGPLLDDEVILITYGDSLQQPGQPHLRSLGDFLSTQLAGVFSTVHVLPFFPSSSDGGFAIVDYDQIDEPLGTWADLAVLDTAETMVDLVCNHGSAQSQWFQQFLADQEPGRSMFLTADPSHDLSAVVRPRTHPLLVPVTTAAGDKHVWATFSSDQVDFDFTQPAVLVEFCRILGSYVSHGATRIRLDAIAYLWKRIGTSCIHLSETHEVVKLMRTLVDSTEQPVALITETNVPHEDNISYFGNGDEAHVVYNFTLAPLIVWSLIAERSDVLTRWLSELEPPPPGCAFLNFLASHDGIGLRPVEDLIDASDLDDLVEAVKATGGDYSAYSTPDGERPYELNVSLVDLLAGSGGETAARFVLAHALMLAMQGMPAIYIHSMLVSAGDVDTVAETQHKRDINRARVGLDDAVAQIESGWRGEAHQDLVRLINVRRGHVDFGPNSPQEVLAIDDRVVAVRRGSIVAVHNVTADAIDLTDLLPAGCPTFDLISGSSFEGQLAGWQAVWLS